MQTVIAAQTPKAPRTCPVARSVIDPAPCQSATDPLRLALVVQYIHFAEISQPGHHLAGRTAHPNVSFGSFTSFPLSRRVPFAPRADIRPMPAFMSARPSTTLADLLRPPFVANPFSTMRASLRR